MSEEKKETQQTADKQEQKPKQEPAAQEKPLAKTEELEKTVKELTAKLEEMQKQLKAATEDAARARADYYNLRTRVARDNEQNIKLAAEKSVKELLPVFENLERIGDSIKDKEDSLFKGFQMVAANFMQVMTGLGLEAIPTDGKFDPSLHEAVMSEPTDDKEKDGDIIAVYRKGYRLAGRVIRAPQVRVAKYEG